MAGTGLFSFLIVVLSVFTGDQNKKLVGAWYWSDGKEAISLFIKDNSSLQMHRGAKGDAMLEKDLRKGVYKLSGAELSLKWSDGYNERWQIKIIDNNAVRFSMKEHGKNVQRVFSRVVDEEVIEEKGNE